MSSSKNQEASSKKDARSNPRNVITDLRFPNMRDLAEHLYFNAQEGMIWLGDQRMMLMQAQAFGASRQELVQSMDVDYSRSVFTRLG